MESRRGRRALTTAAIVLFFVAVGAVFTIAFAGMWKAFAKAGLPGWGALVPLYNSYLMWRLSQTRRLALVGLFIPVVSVVAFVYVMLKIAERFARSPAFGVGLLLLPSVYWPILGFGRSEWTGRDCERTLSSPFTSQPVGSAARDSPVLRSSTEDAGG